ncbi:MAG: hypothetical protein J6U51_07110 [Bacteroidales bacterium]|nr:hypothetical protein [Bacteroidales bacterium]
MATVGNGDFTLILDEQTKQALYAKLQGLSDFEKEETVKRGLKEGAKVIVQQGKANYNILHKKRTGNLYKSAGISTSKRMLKVWGGFKRPKGAAAHLIDKGTTERFTKKGASRGKVTASKFWTSAFMAKKEAASKKMMDIITKTVEAIWNL